MKKSKSIKKAIFSIAGSIAFGLGVIGLLLPILPTTPFLLATGYCYLRSFDNLNEKFQKSFLYKKYVLKLIEGKGLTLKAKLAILIPVLSMLGAIFYFSDNLLVRSIIATLVIIKILVFIKIKTNP